ncbi:MAG: CRTAC1 family protein [Planctomycetales bacterium]|nr:CRTAC1 family protein [Planctomycetales bacterium]
MGCGSAPTTTAREENAESVESGHDVSASSIPSADSPSPSAASAGGSSSPPSATHRHATNASTREAEHDHAFPPTPSRGDLFELDFPVVGDPRTAGTRGMSERLAKLVAVASPQGIPSMSRATNIERLRDRLTTEKKPGNHVLIQLHIAWQTMLDGQNEEAVKLFEAMAREFGTLTLPPDQGFNTNYYSLAGTAYLRLAEQRNCIENHGQESCIFPLRGTGLHDVAAPARRAQSCYHKLCENDKDDLAARWLYNVASMAIGEYPDKVDPELLIPPSAFESDYDIKRFVDVAPAAGVATVGLSGGAITDDFNNDGFIDIMASDWGIDKQLRLFLNRGDGTFQEVTEQAGLIGEVGGLNLVSTDFDNDGLVDVYVLRGAWLQEHGHFPNSLLRNLGDGRFDDVTESAGLLSQLGTQSAAWADYDLDGWLDLFVGNESDRETNPCQLFRNNGDGTFTDMARDVGVAHVGFVKGVAWGDVNNDGRPDLYLSCFGQPNVLYVNSLDELTGSASFQDSTEAAGVRFPLGSFPVWFWDFDNDGWEDLLVAPFSGFNFDGSALAKVVSEYLGRDSGADCIHLYHNNHDGTFTNVAPEMHLAKPLLAMGANFGDLDNDGLLDCYFGTGDPSFTTLVPNRAFRNAGGNAFQDITTSGGLGHLQKGHGIAFADLDNDGDQDVFAVMGGAIAGDIYPNVLFENPGHGHHWVTLRFHGAQSNRLGVGARVKLAVNSPQGNRKICVTVGSGGSFGASSLQQEIGLGAATSIDSLEVTWPGQADPQRFENVPMDQVWEIRQGATELVGVPSRSFQFPQAADTPHEHHH